MISSTTNTNGKACNCTQFELVDQMVTDFQEIRIQENVSKLSMGSMPRSISVILQNDLVDFAKAGDDVQIIGYVRRRWEPVVRGARCTLELIIEAISARVTNNVKGSGGMTNDALEDIKLYWQEARESGKIISARNHIIKSFCPQIYGLYAVKLALALVLTGGNTMTTNDGLRLRGDSHKDTLRAERVTCGSASCSDSSPCAGTGARSSSGFVLSVARRPAVRPLRRRSRFAAIASFFSLAGT